MFMSVYLVKTSSLDLESLHDLSTIKDSPISFLIASINYQSNAVSRDHLNTPGFFHDLDWLVDVDNIRVLDWNRTSFRYCCDTYMVRCL